MPYLEFGDDGDDSAVAATVSFGVGVCKQALQKRIHRFFQQAEEFRRDWILHTGGKMFQGVAFMF